MTIGRQQTLETVRYSPAAGQYRGSDGRFVSRAKVLELVNDETRRLEIRLTGLTRRLVSGNLALPEWERAFADELKQSHLRMATFAAGGKEGMGNVQYGTVGRALRDQYRYLDRFAREIAAGRLTERQILFRAAQYARSSQTSYYRSERLTKQQEGFNEARRWLGVALHCGDCIDYDTGGEWLPIGDVIPPGVSCQCFHNCKCMISYRRNFPDISQLSEVILNDLAPEPTLEDIESLFGSRRRSAPTGRGRGFG